MFSASVDVLPGSGCPLVFPMALDERNVREGELATAFVDEDQPPLEYDFSNAGEVVVRIAVRDLQRLVPE